MVVYILPVALPAPDPRWQLYRLLADPARLRVLALAAEEELTLGELAEVLGESQPNLSRHAAPLRQAGLLSDRRQGTRTFVRLTPGAATDPVVGDALATGRGLCRDEGRFARLSEVLHERDARSRELFAQGDSPDAAGQGGSPAPTAPEPPSVAHELPAYLFALAGVGVRRRLAVDAGTGEGALLDVLAPSFERVVAVDRSPVRLAQAARRVARRGYDNVTLVHAELGSAELAAGAPGGASLVVASRVLHHAPRPRESLRALGALLAPGGALVVIDYDRHEDERFREQAADVWMGFEIDELASLAAEAGLDAIEVLRIPRGLVGAGPDEHLPWLALRALRPTEPSEGPSAPGPSGARRRHRTP